MMRYPMSYIRVYSNFKCVCMCYVCMCYVCMCMCDIKKEL